MEVDQKQVDDLFRFLFKFGRRRSALGVMRATRELYDQYHKLLAQAERLKARALAAEEQLRRVEK